MTEFVPSATGSRCRKRDYALVPEGAKGGSRAATGLYGRLRTGCCATWGRIEELSGYKRPKLQILACRMMTNWGGGGGKQESVESRMLFSTNTSEGTQRKDLLASSLRRGTRETGVRGTHEVRGILSRCRLRLRGARRNGYTIYNAPPLRRLVGQWPPGFPHSRKCRETPPTSQPVSKAVRPVNSATLARVPAKVTPSGLGACLTLALITTTSQETRLFCSNNTLDLIYHRGTFPTESRPHRALGREN